MKPYINSSTSDLTTYDFLKLLAVVTMIIDHVGHYLFPEQMEFRAIGRMSMPIWLFLVGYATTREIPPILWGGAFILLGSFVVAGNDIFALNILFTIIITRTIIDTLVKITFKNGENFMLSMATMVLLGIPTAILFDYGTLALMWAMFGYVCRHKQEMNLSQFKVLGFLGLTLALYFGYQQLFFTFAPAYMWAMVVFVSISAYLLYNFKPKALPDLTAKLPAAVNAFIKFSGRKTLYIYVVHILIFLTIAFFTQPDRFGFFQIELY